MASRNLKKALKLALEIQATKKEVEEEYKYITDSVIDEWYDSYKNRGSYEPYGSLHNAVQVISDESMIDIQEDPTLGGVHHHQDNSIIYNNAYVLGYHGGSTGKGLNSSKPHYRKPSPFYPRWGRTAKKNFSPQRRIDQRMKKFDKQMQKRIDDTCAEIAKLISG